MLSPFGGQPKAAIAAAAGSAADAEEDPQYQLSSTPRSLLEFRHAQAAGSPPSFSAAAEAIASVSPTALSDATANTAAEQTASPDLYTNGAMLAARVRLFSFC